MSRFQVCRACFLTSALAVALAATGTSAASATTFYVNAGVGASGDCLSQASACKKIHEAIVKARTVPDTATIQVAAGTYVEDMQINAEGDAGLTIDGAGSGSSDATIVVGEPGAPTIDATSPGNPGPTTLENLRIVNPVGDEEIALLANRSSLIASNVAIEMQDSKDTEAAIEVNQTSAALDRLTVGGSWTGNAVLGFGSVAITRSSLATTSSAAIVFEQSVEGGGRMDSISDSTVRSATGEANVEGLETDLTIDSSLLLGGTKIGVEWTHVGEKQGDLTVAGSTIDAGALGVRDSLPVSDIYAVGGSPKGSVANAQVQGSILMDPQTATGAGEGQLSIACSYSDVPSQKQASALGGGEIDCADGENGNTTSTPSSLFVAPGTDYELLPGSSAIDSVPASAISLPFGLTPSPTDVAGNPRVMDGNGDCVAVQDKGALELQGHSAACPPGHTPPLVACPESPGVCAPLVVCPTSSGSCPPGHPLVPLVPVITALKVTPSSFFAAPSGATISKTSKTTTKKTYGTTIAYSDSQAATTTFTVLSETPGNMQGKSCRKPSKSNKHGKRCTILKTIGGFTHTDTAGANKLRFSGRLGAKKLAKGSYKLQAVPRGVAGSGVTVSTGFKID